MKKRIFRAVLLLIIPVMLGVFFIQKNAPAPDTPFNYLEYGRGKTMLVLRDHVVFQQNTNGLSACEKTTGRVFPFGADVFDLNRQNVYLLYGEDNTVYYCCAEGEVGGSAVFAFDFDSFQKTKLSAYNSITDFNAFLGMGSILGMTAPGSNLLQMWRRTPWLRMNGKWRSQEELGGYLDDLDKNNDYLIPQHLEKYAVSENRIVFKNSREKLICFHKETKAFTPFPQGNVGDFFLAGDTLYYTDLEDMGLYAADAEGNGKRFIANAVPESIRVTPSGVYIRDTDYKIYALENDTLSYLTVSEADDWIIDQGVLYENQYGFAGYLFRHTSL